LTSPRKEELADGVTVWLGDAREIVPLVSADALVSDVPYGINAVLGMGGGSKGDGGMWAGVGIAGDESVTLRDEVLQLAGLPFAVFAKVNTPRPAGTRATVVWDKGEHTGAGDLSLPWKPSFDLVHVGGPGWTGTARVGGVIRVNAVAGCVADRNDGKRFHPFEKPVGIMTHFCERAPGRVILDPFMGSGTTGVAAVQLGRGFVGIELEPEYFSTACRRIREALKSPSLFVPAPAPAPVKQETFL
jgi:hypothetical protein